MVVLVGKNKTRQTIIKTNETGVNQYGHELVSGSPRRYLLGTFSRYYREQRPRTASERHYPQYITLNNYPLEEHT